MGCWTIFLMMASSSIIPTLQMQGQVNLVYYNNPTYMPNPNLCLGLEPLSTYALRDIKKGEEVRTSYEKFGTILHPCKFLLVIFSCEKIMLLVNILPGFWLCVRTMKLTSTMWKCENVGRYDFMPDYSPCVVRGCFPKVILQTLFTFKCYIKPLLLSFMLNHYF